MTRPIRKTKLTIPTKVVKAVKEFEKAVIDYAFKGTQPVEEFDRIIENYDKTKLKLYRAIQDFKEKE